MRCGPDQEQQQQQQHTHTHTHTLLDIMTTTTSDVLDPDKWTCSANEALHVSLGM